LLIPAANTFREFRRAMPTFANRAMALAPVATFVFAGLLAGTPALAQSFGITPTLLEVAPGRRGAVLSVTNTTAIAIEVQARPYDWQQVEGHDKLTDSTTLLVSPSIMTIPPGGAQLLRVLVPAGPRTTEGNWRIILDQLPHATPLAGMQVRLRMSIPVFAYAGKAEARSLRWSIVGGRLEVVNLGQRYLRLSSLAVRTSDGREMPLALGDTPYFLPNSRRHWSEPSATLAGSQVVAHTGTDSFVVPMTLAPAP
jgi:fimbrial chaperone protein